MPFFHPTVLSAPTEHRGDCLDFLRGRTKVAQDGRDRITLSERDRFLVVVVAAGCLGRGFRQERNVFGDHPRFKAGIWVWISFRRIGQLGSGAQAGIHPDNIDIAVTVLPARSSRRSQSVR